MPAKPAPSKHEQTPARRRGLALIGQAMANHWSASRFAKEARIGYDLANAMIKEEAKKTKKILEHKAESRLSRLVAVARKAQDAEITHIERQIAVNERLLRQLETGQDLSAKEAKDLVSLRATHYKLMESVTGLDVAKAVAVRKATDKGGSMLAWDGVETIELDALPLFAGEDELEIEEDETPAALDITEQEFETDPLAEFW